MNNNVLRGSIFIALGASSYGMLATFVKMAYHEGYSTAEVTISQFCLGFLGLFLLTLLQKRDTVTNQKKIGIKNITALMLAGIPMGLTSIFYYMAVQYIPVSIGIVLLMQAVWMGVILEMILHKNLPGTRKIISVIIILLGTVLATNLLNETIQIHWIGFGWGILAAMSYTATMYATNHIELDFHPIKRSLYMILGGLFTIALIFHSSININFTFQIFTHWGLILALFGTILPPLLFTKGMPLTGVGFGAIVASVEIPVSICMAYVLLNEPVSALQWLGVAIILCAVVLMNIEKRKKIQN